MGEESNRWQRHTEVGRHRQTFQNRTICIIQKFILCPVHKNYHTSLICKFFCNSSPEKVVGGQGGLPYNCTKINVFYTGILIKTVKETCPVFR
jgi:hypothetical protein